MVPLKKYKNMRSFGAKGAENFYGIVTKLRRVLTNNGAKQITIKVAPSKVKFV